MADTLPEPWLRGPLPDVHPLVMPVFFSFAQVREDLAKHTAAFTQQQIWEKIGGTPLAFHLKHIAGSVDRLTTYITGEQLTEQQLRSLKEESQFDDQNLPEMLQVINQSLNRSEKRLRELDPKALYDARSVGRKALPTTVIGLLVHLAEHTQRHLGQVITICNILRQRG